MVTSIVPTRFCPFFGNTFVFRNNGCWLREEQLARMVPEQPVRVLAKDYFTLIHTSASFSGSTINIYDHKSTMGNQPQRPFHASHSYLAVFSRPTIHIIIIMNTSWGISLAFLGLSFVYRLILGISLEHVYILDGES